MKPNKSTKKRVLEQFEDDIEESMSNHSESEEVEDFARDEESVDAEEAEYYEDEMEDEQVEKGTEENKPYRPKPTQEEKNRQRKEQRELKKDRKKARKFSEMIDEAKSIWNKIRQRKMDEKERSELMDELFKNVKGHVQDVIFKHDASRIIQTMMKYGNADIRNAIATELKGTYVELSKSKYAKFIVKKVLTYCIPMRAAVMKEFHGHVLKLIKHREASSIIEDMYALYADASQRAALIEEFYGAEFAIFKKLDRRLTLQQILTEKPEKKKSVMSDILKVLNTVLDKGTIHHTLIHKILLEFLNQASEDQIQEILETLKEQIAEIIHTKDGHKIALKCFALSNAKDRKVILKSLKPFLGKVFADEYGYLVMIAMLMITDDTVLSSKIILQEYMNRLSEYVFNDENGHAFKILLYLISGELKSVYFPVHAIELINQSVEEGKTHSKKDLETKHKELYDFAFDSVQKFILKELDRLIVDQKKSAILSEYYLKTSDDKVLNAIEEKLIAEYDAEHLFNNAVASKLLKKWISQSPQAAKMILRTCQQNWLKMIGSDGIYAVVTLSKALPKEMAKELRPFTKQIKSMYKKSQDSKLKMLLDLFQ